MDTLDKINKIEVAVRAILGFIVVSGLIFGSAGRLDYWQGWLLYGNYIILGIVGFVLFKDKMAFIKERMKPGKGIKWWDKVFYAFFIPLSLATFVIGSLDSGRLGWTNEFPVWLTVTGFVIFNLSAAVVLWSMVVNQFFSSVVRIQEDRGQTVVKTGPYKFVRHPGYTGSILSVISITACLGSIYALIPAGLTSLALVIRTRLEDKTLKSELEGYQEYATQVKYRLFPLIW